MSHRSVLFLAVLLSAAGWAQDAGPTQAPAAPAPNPQEWTNARELIEEAAGYLKEITDETAEADNKCSPKVVAKLEVIGTNLKALSSKFDRPLLRQTYVLSEDMRALVQSDCPASFARRAERRLERVVGRLQRADKQIR